MKKNIKLIIITLLTLVILYFFLKNSIIRELIYLIIVSFIISYSLKPAYVKFVENGINKKLSAIFLIAIFFIVLILCMVIIIPYIFREGSSIKNAISGLQEIVDKINYSVALLKDNKVMQGIINSVYEKSNVILNNVLSNALNMAVNIGEDLLSFAVIPIIVYYFLADGDRINNRILMLFPVSLRVIVKKICGDIDKILGRYIVSQFILCAIIGVMTFSILIVLHVDFPIILALLNACFNIIPYFGPIFGAIPAVIIALMKSQTTAIYTIIALYIIQQVEGDIISPKITGESVSMHPLVVILLLILGGKLGGLLGMILAIPIGVILKIIYEDLNYYFF